MAKAIKVTIDGTIRTSLVDWRTLKITKNLTSQVDTAEMKYEKFGSRTWEPAEGLETIIEFDADDGNGYQRVFAGYSIDVSVDTVRAGHRIYTIKCKDYNYLLDKRLAVSNFASKTPKQIVDSLIAEYAYGLGITSSGVDTTPTITRIDFKYLPIRECIQRISDITYKDWYIDENKDIHLFDKENTPAPFSITDTNGYMVSGSLDIDYDLSNLKNRVVVRGGEYEGSTVPERFTGEGSTGTEKKIFVLGYKPKISGFTLVVTSTGGVSSTGTIGIEGLADENAVTAVVSQQTRTLRFTTGNFPTNNEIINITYTPILGVIVAGEKTSSVTTYGYREFELVDSNINSKQSAKDVINAQLNAYAEPIVKGSFTTYSDGLDTGQLITITSTHAGIDDDYLIYQLTLSPNTPTTFKYTAKFVSTRNFGVIELFQKLLTEPGRIIGGFTEDDMEKVESRSEKIAIIESVVAQTGGDYSLTDNIELTEDTAYAIDTPKTWVWGQYHPTSLADTKRPLFFNVGSKWAS